MRPITALFIAVAIHAVCVLGAGDAGKPFASDEPIDLLSAPWTSFKANGDVDLDAIPLTVQKLQKWGVTTVWVNGAMSQWASLQLAERKAIVEAYLPALKEAGLYSIVQVGSQCLRDAMELARHAAEHGADSIAALPPFSPDKPKDMHSLVETLQQIASSVPPSTPFYYYHFPGMTGVDVTMFDLFSAAHARIPNLAGAKFVDSNRTDFIETRNMLGGKFHMWWAPEPKLQIMDTGCRSFVLAEGYYAPYLKDVISAYDKGGSAAAQPKQAVLDKLHTVIGSANRDVMDMVGVPMGAPRLPKEDITNQVYTAAFHQLHALGFFEKLGEQDASTEVLIS